MNKTNAFLEIFNFHGTQKKENQTAKHSWLKVIYFKIMSTEIDDIFSYLWFQYFFTCSLLVSGP